MNPNPPTPLEFHSENSAFAPYRRRPVPGDGGDGGSNNRRMNTNKRMIELLRSKWSAIGNAGEPDRGRSYRHMMRERARRENQKQSYVALHSLLPLGTKVFHICEAKSLVLDLESNNLRTFSVDLPLLQGDKNSIIEMAAHEIKKLQSSREELKRRNLELKSKSMEQAMVFNIGLRVGNPSSGIDSMVEVLKCLKNMDLKTTAIRSEFSPQQFSAVLKMQTQVLLYSNFPLLSFIFYPTSPLIEKAFKNEAKEM